MTHVAEFSTASELQALNSYLESRSYIQGYSTSQADTVVYAAVAASTVDRAQLTHVARWFKHIASFGEKSASFPGSKPTIASLGITAAATGPKKAEDDLDLFGSDEEDDAEVEAQKAQRLAEYNARKATKPTVVAKSSVIIDVKPWEDTTDLVAMEAAVRAIEMDGLIWGTSKLMPIGYGIKKLQISCAIEDAKVSMDTVEELIVANEDLVQSVDIVAFNKI